MDNLMHSTTEEIAAWIRTIELPPGPNPTREELGTFYEDETIARAPENGRLEYDEAGRKVVPYPTPPHTPPPAALLAQMLTNVEHPSGTMIPEATAYNPKRLPTGNKVLTLATANMVYRLAHSANMVYPQAFHANNAMPEATAYNPKRLPTGNKVLTLATANKVSRVVSSIRNTGC
ncbi:hypothetical protein A1F94_012235 [Pyrenophora tritici-repentis]|nr:hypothetical protein A1F94_012235 [Pyrenophora tritici-repentis]